MRSTLACLYLAVSALTATGAGATVLHLEPFGLALGAATEDEVRGRLGAPLPRAELPGGAIALRFVPAEGGIGEMRARLVPDQDGTARLDRLSVIYAAQPEAARLRAHFGLGKPLWEGRESIDGAHCLVEYHERARLSAHQTGSLALTFCEDTAAVSVLSYLSQRALHEAARRDGVPLESGTLVEAGLARLGFAAEDVLYVTIAVDWAAADPASAVRSLIRRKGAGFVHDGKPIDPGPLAILGRSLDSVVPVTVLQSCDGAASGVRGAQDIRHPRVELAVRTQQLKLIKFRSASGCALMSSWNVSDGQQLFAASAKQVGEAIRDLVQPACPACRFDQAPALPPVARAAEGHNRFARLRIETAMYGSNCQRDPSAPLYAAVHLAHACGAGDAARCEYLIDPRLIGDPAAGCRKSYSYRWRCPDGKAHEGYVGPEASGRRIVLACPQ